MPAEIDEGQGGKSTKDLACAADRGRLAADFERRLLERCVLAETAMIGKIACAGGTEIVLSGDGLDIRTLASAQRVVKITFANFYDTCYPPEVAPIWRTSLPR